MRKIACPNFKRVVACDFTFLTCVMLLFEPKQHLQQVTTFSSKQMELFNFTEIAF